MKQNIWNRLFASQAAILTLGLLVLLSAPVSAENKLPETTTEGLQLQQNTELAAVYKKPGETFEDYHRFAITDVYVAFKKDWQRDYNRSNRDLQGRVTDEDMEDIKSKVADEFLAVFTKELGDKGGYELVNTAAEDVLTIQPSILDLVVNAPDLGTSSVARTFVTSAGEMTLYLEFFDSKTGAKLGEVLDREAAGAYGIAHAGGRVTNKSDFDEVLEKWAEILRKRMDEVIK